MHLSCLLVVLLVSAPAFGQRRPLLVQPQFRPQVLGPQENTLLPQEVTSRRPLAQPQYRPQQQEATSEVLGQVQDVSPDGSFYTKYETSNGISYEERGQLASNGQVEAEKVVGSASWVDNEGQRFSISWQADENGALFQGDHLPTPPPIPEAIQRALAYIAANPGRDGGEGQYREQDYDNQGRFASPQLTGSPTYPTTLRPAAYPTTLRPASYPTTLGRAYP